MNYIEVLRSFDDLNDKMNKQAKRLKISKPALIGLLKMKHYGLKTQKEIVEYAYRKNSDASDKEIKKFKVIISNALKELEEVKLIKKIQDKNDKRKNFIELTPKAIKIAEKFEGDNYG